VDYFSAALLSGIADTDTYVSTMFHITENTISFLTGGGSAAEGAITVSLYTDFKGDYLAAKSGGDGGLRGFETILQGTERRSHAPVRGVRYPVVWEVAGLVGRKAAITVVDRDPSGQAVFDDLRVYHTESGCLPECLMIRAEPCLAEFPLPESGMTCLYFNGNTQPYVPQKKQKHGLVQYCQMGLGPFGENGQANLMDGWEEGVISHERMNMFSHLPVCVSVEVVGATAFGLALSPEDPIFVLDSRNAPAASTGDELHCLYETSKPRCASFGGTLKGRTQHNLYCKEVDAEPSCLEHVIDMTCVSGELCGTDQQGEPMRSTLNLLECCDGANNRPGSYPGCLSTQSRRLTEAVEEVGSLKLQDLGTAGACAEACLRRANGPLGDPREDACVAWRLNAEGECKLTADCMFADRADTMLVSKKLWNTFEGVDMFKGQATPAPKLVRKKVGAVAE